MDRSRAAEGHHGEVARIQATFDRDQPDASSHALVDHGQDGLGGFLDPEAEPFA